MENLNEVVTRGREQKLNEQKNNYQIQQNNLLPKKQILIPIVVETNDFKSNIWQLKMEQVVKLRKEFVGYIRLQELVSAPSLEAFEPDSEDLEFIKSLFPKEFKSIDMNDPAVFNLNACKDFIKVVEYIERTRDFTFKSLPLINSKMNTDCLQKLYEYWRAKTARTKYPLMRKFWNANLKKEDFGKLEQLRVAYRDREPDKKKSTRQSRKLTSDELSKQLKQIQESSHVLERVAVLTCRREMLKLAKLSLQLGGSDALQFVKDDLLKGTEHDIREGNDLYLEYNPPQISPPSLKMSPEPIIPDIVIPKPIKQPENEIAYFVSSLLCELQKFDFDINEIRMDNLAQINMKIRTLKQSQIQQSQTNTSEKTICLSLRPTKPDIPKFDNFVPYKRISFACPQDVFIEKVDQSVLKSNLNEPFGKNFVPDYLIKRNFGRLYQDFSLFRINATSGFNPEVYCETGSYSTSNINFENFKNMKNSRLYEELNQLEEPLSSGPEQEIEATEVSLIQRAEMDINDLKLGAGFKNWLNNKRVKMA